MDISTMAVPRLATSPLSCAIRSIATSPYAATERRRPYGWENIGSSFG